MAFCNILNEHSRAALEGEVHVVVAALDCSQFRNEKSLLCVEFDMKMRNGEEKEAERRDEELEQWNADEIIVWFVIALAASRMLRNGKTFDDWREASWAR